ncbi:MAG: reverse transcriptase-like protein, partial [Bacteroidetes bacterium]|nr:reverse transcriptase-like protein [Bacteroidota bacterium]
IFALKKLKLLVGKKNTKQTEVEIRSDSELLVSQLNGKYKIKEEHIGKLFLEVWNLRVDFGEVRFTHVRREKNKDADALVNQALDQEASKLF